MPKRSNAWRRTTASTRRRSLRTPDAEGEVDGEGHRRRRRRRGGRGRGRGRGQDREVPTEAGAPGVASAAGSTDDDDEEDEDLDAYPAPRAPQASTFGSVWDSQIGVPAHRSPAPTSAARPPTTRTRMSRRSPSTCWPSGGSAPVVPAGVRRNPVAVEAGDRGVAVAPISRPSIVSDMDDRVAAPSAATAATATLPRGPIAGLDRTAVPGTAAARRGPIAGRAPIGRRHARRQPALDRRSMVGGPAGAGGDAARRARPQGCSSSGAPSTEATLAPTPAEEPGGRRDASRRGRDGESVTEVATTSGAEVKPRRRAPAGRRPRPRPRPARRSTRQPSSPRPSRSAERRPARRPRRTAHAAAVGDEPAAADAEAKPKRRRAHARPPRRPESVGGFGPAGSLPRWPSSHGPSLPSGRRTPCSSSGRPCRQDDAGPGSGSRFAVPGRRPGRSAVSAVQRVSESRARQPSRLASSAAGAGQQISSARCSRSSPTWHCCRSRGASALLSSNRHSA